MRLSWKGALNFSNQRILPPVAFKAKKGKWPFKAVRRYIKQGEAMSARAYLILLGNSV